MIEWRLLKFLGGFEVSGELGKMERSICEEGEGEVGGEGMSSRFDNWILSEPEDRVRVAKDGGKEVVMSRPWREPLGVCLWW